MIAPAWRLITPGSTGLPALTAHPDDADALLALRDPRLGDGAGRFLAEAVGSILLADFWSTVGTLDELGLRSVVLLDPVAATGLKLLADCGVTGYRMALPGGVRLGELVGRVGLHEAAVVAADALLAAVPAPVGLVEEVRR